jgi:hypothetical protein
MLRSTVLIAGLLACFTAFAQAPQEGGSGRGPARGRVGT